MLLVQRCVKVQDVALGVETRKRSSIQLSDYINYQCGAATHFQHGKSGKCTVASDYTVVRCTMIRPTQYMYH